MKLAAKLILLFLVGLLLIVGLFSYTTIVRERRIAMEMHEQYAEEMADLLKRSSPAVAADPNARAVRIRRVDIANLDEGNRIYYRQQVTTVLAPDAAGKDRFFTYIPPEGNSEEDGLEISAEDSKAKERVNRTVLSSLMTLAGVALLSGLVVVIGGVRMVGRPLEQLIAKVNRVSEGDFEGPIKLQSDDELGRLGKAINEMCDHLSQQRREIQQETNSRIEATTQLRHADRLQSVGRMAAGIAHEIGTPLNVVSGRAELIASGELSEEANRESALAIQHESQRIAKIISGLLDFARQRPPEMTRADLADLIKTTVDLIQPLAHKSGATIKYEQPTGAAWIQIDATQIQQVLTNLLNNAIESSDRAVEVIVSLTEANDAYRMSVRDNGDGISADDLDRLFEPFFTRKDVGDGTGLGLAISHGIVEEHGGSIEVESDLEKGTTFTVVLPRASEMQADETS